MKGVFALAALGLLAGCSSMNMFNKAEPEGKWTTWTCDSKAEVNWRFANQARSEVDVRLGGSDQVYRLKQDVAASGVLENGEGLAVLGEGGTPITVPPGFSISLAADGTVPLAGRWAILGAAEALSEAVAAGALDKTNAEAELQRLREAPPVSAPGWQMPVIELRRGAGAYICGEESAMIESIEGKRGEPRLRPPYIAQVGLFGRPTLEHNFETLYWVRDIVQRGPAWFSGFGRNGRTGLRSFSVSGRVQQPGVKLAPAGITLRELVDEYCGGMVEGHTLYAYLPGGASGGILPASLADAPLDFDTLQPHGSFIGSAAVVVLSEADSARDAALNAMRFFAHESCGQCTPCRVGTEKASALMAQPGDWDALTLEDLAVVMTDASICGLGQAAPNPMRCVLKYFPHEVQAAGAKAST